MNLEEDVALATLQLNQIGMAFYNFIGWCFNNYLIGIPLLILIIIAFVKVILFIIQSFDSHY